MLIYTKRAFQPFYLQFIKEKQSNKQQTKPLNKTPHFSKYGNFKRFLKSFFMRFKQLMCNNDVYYFRITNTTIIPQFLQWHLIQDFEHEAIKLRVNNDDRKFLFKRHLGNRIIRYGMLSSTFRDLGHFVEKERDANLSIGWTPNNFGEVELLRLLR